MRWDLLKFGRAEKAKNIALKVKDDEEEEPSDDE